jgi:hypothetical protein
LILVVVLVGVFWWLFFLGLHRCHYNPVDYMNVRVETTSNLEYELYLPIPVEAPNQTWYLVDFLGVTKGNATWSTIMTPYGIALKISGRGNVSLRAAASSSKYPYAGFSPSNRTDIGPGHLYAEYFVFANASGSESAMSIYVGAGTSTPDGYPQTTVIQVQEGLLKKGWQVALGDTSVMVC